MSCAATRRAQMLIQVAGGQSEHFCNMFYVKYNAYFNSTLKLMRKFSLNPLFLVPLYLALQLPRLLNLSELDPCPWNLSFLLIITD
jgi:hypothetical protein